jgi:hypothetical protein
MPTRRENIDWNVDATLMGSNIINPVDIQARYSQTIQTHNAVSVGVSSASNSAWIDCNGFSDVAISFVNDAATNMNLELRWSHDGVTDHGWELAVITGNQQKKSIQTSVKARYLRVIIANLDTVGNIAHTMSTWTYLKA